MRILSAVHPTENQKRVLAKIIAAPTPTVAAEEISNNANMVAARNMLMKLGVITFGAGEASLTDKGEQIAREENIADESGQLTDVGQQLAYGEQKQGGETEPPPPPGGGLSLESFALLKELLN